MTETILFLQKLLWCTSSISLRHTPCKNADLLTFFQDCTGYHFDALLEQDPFIKKQLLQTPIHENTIHVYTPFSAVTFVLYKNTRLDSLLFLGPVLTQNVSEEDILQALASYSLTKEMTKRITDYCAALPVFNYPVFYETCDLVIGHIAGKATERSQVPYPSDNPLAHSPYTAGEDIIQMRQVENRYEHSIALTEAIKQGNLSLALHLIGRHTPDSQNPVRNKNPLRNAQNYCIVLNTQLRHAMEETNVHPYRVDKLSNEIGLQIEQLSSMSQLSDFFKSVIRRYCRLVQEYDYPNLKPLVNLTVTYIKEHLSDNLNVKDTAKALTVNANYLSALFRKEMGITFIDFVNRERTRQALGLLIHTNLQIQQISSLVGYNNTSYFSKQFLRFQQVSPSYYRKNL